MMMAPHRVLCALSITLLGWPASAQSTTVASATALALAAAPPAIARGSAVVMMRDHGQMKELRHGTNGWTCVMVDPPMLAYEPGD
jgi:hypothetical protein